MVVVYSAGASVVMVTVSCFSLLCCVMVVDGGNGVKLLKVMERAAGNCGAC